MDNSGKGKETEIQKHVEEAYKTHKEKLVTYIQTSVSNASVVEDILHDVFLAAINSGDTFLEHPNRIGWLYNTARYKIKEYHRKLYAVDTVDIDDENVEIGVEESGYLEKELDLELKEVLLPEEYMRYYRYFHWRYAVEDMARMEGITVNNMRVKLSRLKKKLQEHGNRKFMR